jgi:hypothetical protein
MELVVALVSALLGLSAAFFLSISFYDLVPDGWLRIGGPRTVRFDALGGRQALLPRSIHHTPLD